MLYISYKLIKNIIKLIKNRSQLNTYPCLYLIKNRKALDENIDSVKWLSNCFG